MNKRIPYAAAVIVAAIVTLDSHGGVGGACCLPSGDCVGGISAELCDVLGGEYQGNNTSCDDVGCDIGPEQGACCLTDGACLLTDLVECATLGGNFQGAGTDCTTRCGACCFVSGTCAVTSSTQCEAAAGTFVGDGTACAGILCPIGRCCVPGSEPCTVECIEVIEEECTALGGEFAGAKTLCEGGCDPVPSLACCFSDGACIDTCAEECAAQGGTEQGSGSSCGAVECVSSSEDCNDNEIPDDVETAPLYQIDPDAQPTDECEDAPYIAPGIVYEATSVTSEALGPDAPEYFFCGLLVGANDVFYRYVAAWDGLVFISVEGPPIDWLYGVYDACPPTAASLIECNEIDHFEVIFHAEKGRTYWIRIAGKYFATGEFDLYLLGPEALLNPTDCNFNGIPDECECLADVNGDDIVDKTDLALVLATLDTTCNGCSEDVDGSGVVDVTDAMIVIQSQGPCPFPDEGG